MYDTDYITGPSDQHGEPCEHCTIDGNVNTVNIYIGLDMLVSCIDCVGDVIFWNDDSDIDPKAEISLAPINELVNA